MKRIKYLLISMILMVPTIVNAEVNQYTTVGLFDTDAQCRTELAKNDRIANANATNGYYLSCIAISCGLNGRVEHHDVEPFSSNVTCANGNTNPYRPLSETDSAISNLHDLQVGATCSIDEQDENYLAAQFATIVQRYNCLQRSDGTEFSSVPTNTTTPANNNPNPNNNGTTNPQTGINTYYAVLGTTVAILSLGLYIVNKKNLFKKI